MNTNIKSTFATILLILATTLSQAQVGIGTGTPTHYLSLGGNSSRTIGLERHSTSGNSGSSLTILAGGAASTGTNLNGGDLILSSGISKGNGLSNIIFRTYPSGASGSADNSVAERMRITSSGNILIGIDAETTGSKLALKGILGILSPNNDLMAISNQTNQYFNIQTYSSKPLYINQLGNDVILSGTEGKVGIGTTTPESSAKLEIASTTQGFLPPRVALEATNNTTIPIASPVEGLIVYNTATAGTSPNNVTPGYYYSTGSAWVRLIVPTDNAANVTGTVDIANGGTGATTAAAALNALLPSQTGNANKILVTDGTNTSWATNVSVTSAVIGSMGNGAANTGANAYTGASITLPPGKWSVTVSMLGLINASGNFWVQTGFSASSTTIGLGADGVSGGPTIVSGLVVGNANNMITGTVIINNTTGTNKTYYYCTASTAGQTLTNLGRNTYGENTIIAYPMN